MSAISVTITLPEDATPELQLMSMLEQCVRAMERTYPEPVSEDGIIRAAEWFHAKYGEQAVGQQEVKP